MPEKSGAGGWRKRIHSRPGAAKLNPEDHVLAETDTESLRPPSERSSWRSTFHSRPGTPSRAPTPTIFQADTDVVRRDITSDVPSPRKATKPKLARYLSGYLSIKDASKVPDMFSEPWFELPPTYIEQVDPMVSLQSVFSHMTSNPSQPIPLHYNSGIFRVFEDYRNIREEKKRLDNLLHETFEGYRAAESFYDKAEAEYQAEIRRLELLIAHGTSGMSGVMKARRESTVERARTHRKTMSYDHTSTSVPAAFENFSTESLDEQIRMRSQQVLLRRPVSPSSKMTILSRCLENAQSVTDFAVGTPPAQEKVTLSRKVHSELNLARLGINCIDGSVPRSIDSGFSGNGDPLPDEVEPSPVMVEPAVDLEAFVALKELGTLVARKRGIDTDKFLTGLMQLYSMPPDNIEHKPKFGAPGQVITTSPFEPVGNTCKASSNMKDAVRQVRSQPPIGSVQRNRRHFSFEPGDDQAAALERQFKAHDTEGLIDSDELGMAFDGQCMSSLRSPSRHADIQKPSKIPSPIQRPGRECVRRESSNSSVRTALQRPDTDERRDSRSSMLTAFRQNSSGSLRPATQSRSSSMHALRHGEGHSSSSGGSLGVRRNYAALAAAKAVDQADNPVPKDNATQSASTPPTLGSSARASRRTGKAQMENASPHAHL